MFWLRNNLSVFVLRNIFRTHFIYFRKSQNVDLTEQYLKTVLIRIRKWSKKGGEGGLGWGESKHSQLISELSDSEMVRMEISRIFL